MTEFSLNRLGALLDSSKTFQFFKIATKMVIELRSRCDIRIDQISWI